MNVRRWFARVRHGVSLHFDIISPVDPEWPDVYAAVTAAYPALVELETRLVGTADEVRPTLCMIGDRLSGASWCTGSIEFDPDTGEVIGQDFYPECVGPDGMISVAS
jgi:hypothetical protein